MTHRSQNEVLFHLIISRYIFIVLARNLNTLFVISFHSWISGQLCDLSDQLKGAMRNAKLNEEDRLKIRKELTVKLEKLKRGISVREIEEAISNNVKSLCRLLTSYFQSEEVMRDFCTWQEKDLPYIDDCHRTNTTLMKATYKRCIEERFQSFLENWENKEKLFAKAHEDLERQFQQSFCNLENDIRDIDRVLVGDSRDGFPPFGTPAGSLCTPLHPNMKKFLVLTLGIFMPVMIPVGLAAGVLSAPVLGYLLIDKHLKERQLKSNVSTDLSQLSKEFLKDSVNDEVLNHVRRTLSNEMNRIAKVQICHRQLTAKYEQRCKDLTKSKDELRDKETLEKCGPLCEKLQEMSDKLMFDAIQTGVQVMNPPCQIDSKSLRYKVQHSLGSGSFGAVFEGKFTPPGQERKKVAVKELKEATCPSSVVSFLQEASILK